MKRVLLLVVLAAIAARSADSQALADLPRLERRDGPPPDHLVRGVDREARAYRGDGGNELILDNGLIRRTWRLEPNVACVAFDNLMTGQSMLRSVRAEARVVLDGVASDVGGLVGQPDHAYLTGAWIDAMRAAPGAFRFAGFAVTEPAERFRWKRRRHAAPDAVWPPRGVHLRMDFLPPEEGADTRGVTEQDAKAETAHVRVSVHYEMYDGLPAMSKWLTVHNAGPVPVTLDRFTVEILAAVEQASRVETRADASPDPVPAYLHVETDFAFGGMTHANANRHVVRWRPDPLYATQVSYLLATPCLLEVGPSRGPAQTIAPGATFESMRAFELVHDGEDRERRGLALRRFYRTLAPWVTENPITHHLLSHDPDGVRLAIDQAAAVGFEAIILSFGSGFDMEDSSEAHVERWREVADYAERRGIEVGSYALFSSRDVGAENMIVSPPGEQPTHGRCPAVTSEWGQDWLRTLRGFYERTGFDQFENDGPYPGDVDVTPRPPLQAGAEDSRWVQWRHTVSLYQWLRERGVYVNAPDYYYLAGTNKCAMGYREVNFSLPRAQQVIHTRQNIYDGTWEKTPSMGWMHVPLAQYHGGGAAATVEPLDDHRDHYERMLLANLGLGVQAHYRGPRLFDTPRTRELVAGTVAWFKQHRDILESDVIHGRRADGRDLDWMLHVNPRLVERGMLCVYNPLDREVAKTLRINLYYTGLTEGATIRGADGENRRVVLARDYAVDVPVRVAAGGMSWYVVTE